VVQTIGKRTISASKESILSVFKYFDMQSLGGVQGGC